MNDASQRPYRLRRPGGEIDSKRVFNVPGVVLLLAAVTSLCFFIFAFSPEQTARIILRMAALSPNILLAGPEYSNGWLGLLAPLIGHMFLHASISHLLFNMLWLLAVGTPVARRMNAGAALQSPSALAAAGVFLTFYFLCGVAGAMTYVAFHMEQGIPLIGASGAVSGLFGAVVRFAFNRSTLFGPENATISPLMSSSVLTWSAILIVMNIAIGIFGGVLLGGARIAWEAHIGGYLFGLLTYPFFERLVRMPR